MGNHEDNYSIGKALWRYSVKDSPMCIVCGCFPIIALVIGIVIAVVLANNNERNILAYTQPSIVNDHLLVANSELHNVSLGEYFHRELRGELELISYPGSARLSFPQQTTLQAWRELLKQQHAVIMKRMLVDLAGMGKIPLAGLTFERGSRYAVVGVGSMNPTNYINDETSDMRIYYHVDVTKQIEDYKQQQN